MAREAPSAEVQSITRGSLVFAGKKKHHHITIPKTKDAPIRETFMSDADVPRIEVRKESGKYVLYTPLAICGNRLYKGDHPKIPNGIWPFTSAQWNTHRTKSSAEAAARQLSDYLTACAKSKLQRK